MTLSVERILGNIFLFDLTMKTTIYTRNSHYSCQTSHHIGLLTVYTLYYTPKRFTLLKVLNI